MLLSNLDIIILPCNLFNKSLSLDTDRAGGSVLAGAGARLSGPVQFQTHQSSSGAPAVLRAQASGADRAVAPACWGAVGGEIQRTQ